MSHELALGVGLLAGSLLYFTLAGYVWLRRHSAGATPLFVLLLAVYWWSKAYAVQLSAETAGAVQVWGVLKYAGIVTVPAAFWAFVHQYTRRRPVTRRTTLLLAVEPVVVLTLLAVPATRELVLVYPADAAAGPGLPMAVPGPLFWPHAVYSYGLLLLALAQFALRVGRVGRPYRRQAGIVLLAAAAPVVGNLLYALDAPGLGRVDPAPFLFLVFAVVLVWGVFRLRLLDLLPAARGVVIEQMADGVLVLDASARVADVNPAGAALVGMPREELVGRYCEEVLPEVEGLLADHLPGATSREELPLRGGDVMVSASLTSLSDAVGAETGRLLVLRDVTSRLQMEWRLREVLAEQTALADTLQAGLRPASLPEVPGVGLAARWVPAAGAVQVSGDFFDVHQTLGGEHAFVIGEVSGRGVRTGVLTSMARYTVRTLSAQGWTPAQVLQQLNQAILTEQNGSLRAGDARETRCCSLAYGRIARIAEDEVGDGLVVTLALGGHPQPLVRHRDGSVDVVGRPGTPLGLSPQVEISEVAVHLRPGDVLVAFTDGVTDARRDGEEFGEDRLAGVLADAGRGLARVPGPVAAGVLADAVADRVLDAVQGFTTSHEDMALLVVSVA